MVTLIIIFVIALIFLAFFKIEHIGKSILLIILLILLLLSFFSIKNKINSGEISFDSPKSTINAFVTYGKFLENKTTSFFNATTKGIKFVGDAIKG